MPHAARLAEFPSFWKHEEHQYIRKVFGAPLWM